MVRPGDSRYHGIQRKQKIIICAVLLQAIRPFEVTHDVTSMVKLTGLSPEDRSREGIFLSFQYPVEIPGVSMVNFLRAALNEQQEI